MTHMMAPPWSAISICPRPRRTGRLSLRRMAADTGSAAAKSTSMGPHLAAHGYAVFAIDYRLTRDGKNQYPAAVNDVRAYSGCAAKPSI
jgi:acetyl esterase/lipase